MIYIISILVFLFIGIFTAAILFTLFYREKPIEKLKYFDEDYVIKEKIQAVKKSKTSPLKVLSELLPNFRYNKKHDMKIEMNLQMADIPITVQELLVIKLFSSAAFSFLSYALTKKFIMVIIMFIIVWNVPRLIIANKKKERLKLFDTQLIEGIMIISNSLKAGYSFLQAVSVVVEETKDPFSKEFKKLLKEMSLGISDEEALNNMIERMTSEDLKLIINAILIQKDIGGNLSEILDNISDTIRERQKIKGELKTLTAQGKLSGIIVMLIPIFLAGVIYLFNKEYILLLFKSPLGIGMIASCVLSQFLGIIMIKKVISIDM
ncbi:MAG: type II secretion system F family protein [Bacillota bacterium]|nr:type II secretion system F family protein [Bacillota bacterium]